MYLSGVINRLDDGLDLVINFLLIDQKVAKISPLTPLFKKGEIPPRRGSPLLKRGREGFLFHVVIIKALWQFLRRFDIQFILNCQINHGAAK